MIPKLIHQTWKTNEIPEQWKESVRSCKELHSDYTHIVWTDDTMNEFMKEHHPDFYPLYRSYTYHIQRCDVFRYFVLYTYGGIYLDLDISCKTKLDPFLKYDFVMSKSSNISISYTNAFMMVTPKHPFMKYCIDHLTENKDALRYFGKHMHVMFSTGPLFLTIQLYQYGPVENKHILTNKEFAGDCSVCNENTCKGGTYFSHVMGNSWHESDSTIYNLILCNLKWIGIVILLLLLLLYGCSSNKPKKGKKSRVS